jgi:hypothetical protein
LIHARGVALALLDHKTWSTNPLLTFTIADIVKKAIRD